MKLSEQELRWLNRWEKRERRWLPVTRWVYVVNGVLSMAAGAYLIRILDRMQMDGISDFGPFVILPFLLFGMGGLWLGLAFTKWRGDIKLRLLLRLIREHEDKDV